MVPVPRHIERYAATVIAVVFQGVETT